MKGTEMKPMKTPSSRPVADATAATAEIPGDRIEGLSVIATRLQRLNDSIDELAATRRRLEDRLLTAMVPLPAEGRDRLAVDESSMSPLAMVIYDFECRVDDEIAQLRHALECVEL